MKKDTFAIKGPNGVTLIELTVVIAIILVLISVLFVGASYYKSNADRAACIINLTNMHKAARTVENINGTAPTKTADFMGTAASPNTNLPIPVEPTCPASGKYSFNAFAGGAKHTAETAGGTKTGGFVLCTIKGHIATDTQGW